MNDVQQLGDGFWCIALPMPGRLGFSLGYAIEDDAGSAHLIVPGSPGETTMRALEDALGSVGHDVEDVVTVTLTHLYIDHIGSAGEVRRRSGARLLMGSREADAISTVRSTGVAHGPERHAAWGVPEERRAELSGPRRTKADLPDIDMTVEDGDLLPVPGRAIRVIFTPGHTSGHICLHSGSDDILLTGDHVLPTVHAGIGIGSPGTGNPIEEYLRSLHRLWPYKDELVAPGHEHVFRGLRPRLASSAAHHLRRTEQVAKALKEDAGATVWEIAASLTWRAGWNGLRRFDLLSALTQTDAHMGFVASDAADDVLRRFRRGESAIAPDLLL